jgi:predicted acylesterase/phospholipase RssA
LEKEIQRIIRSAGYNQSVRFPDDTIKDKNQPGRTFVVATYLDAGGAALMRSYGTRDADPFPAYVWEVARATMAAPPCFLPVNIDGILYGDASLGFNNPTKEAIEEARNLWPKRDIGILVSLGSGLEKTVRLNDWTKQGASPTAVRPIVKDPATRYALQFPAIAKHALECLKSCESAHTEVENRSAREILDNNYFRVNILEEAIFAIGLAEWEKLGELKGIVYRYMERGPQRETKRKIAQLLVKPESANSCAFPHLLY